MKNFKKKFRKSFNEHYQFNDNLSELKQKLTFNEQEKPTSKLSLKWFSLSFACLMIIGILIAAPLIINPQSGKHEVKFVSIETINLDGDNQSSYQINENVLLHIKLENPALYLIKNVEINDKIYDVNEEVGIIIIDIGSFMEVGTYDICLEEIIYQYNNKKYKVNLEDEIIVTVIVNDD